MRCTLLVLERCAPRQVHVRRAWLPTIPPVSGRCELRRLASTTHHSSHTPSKQPAQDKLDTIKTSSSSTPFTARRHATIWLDLDMIGTIASIDQPQRRNLSSAVVMTSVLICISSLAHDHVPIILPSIVAVSMMTWSSTIRCVSCGTIDWHATPVRSAGAHSDCGRTRPEGGLWMVRAKSSSFQVASQCAATNYATGER